MACPAGAEEVVWHGVLRPCVDPGGDVWIYRYAQQVAVRVNNGH